MTPNSWITAKAAKLSAPVAHGSKAVPEDASLDALAGLAFVFTGELSSFSREEAIELAKRFGGRVVGQPSSKTDYVVLGDGAGDSKIKAIQKHNLKTLDEDAFLKLIGERDPSGQAGDKEEKWRKQKQKEEEEMRKAAKEMEKREKS
jgi:replication factor C subunit 1